jgi:hypothetical protein
MSKHTPGPWYIDPIKAHANGNRRIMAEQCTPVAVVPPDLLTALHEIAEWTDRYTTPGHPISTVARAAIAKARGEQ